MSKFFVGCRVRIRYSNHWPELAGQEGRITGRVKPGDFVLSRRCEWDVAPDCWGSTLSPSRDGFFAPSSDAIEPITPSGHQPSEYSFTELMDKCRAGEVEHV